MFENGNLYNPAPLNWGKMGWKGDLGKPSSHTLGMEARAPECIMNSFELWASGHIVLYTGSSFDALETQMQNWHAGSIFFSASKPWLFFKNYLTAFCSYLVYVIEYGGFIFRKNKSTMRWCVYFPIIACPEVLKKFFPLIPQQLANFYYWKNDTYFSTIYNYI